MYTELKSYQIIIALLKKYGIRHCVLSAGSRNVPFVHSIEEDPFFKCYSVVDERSAGYFAMGIAQELNEPVVISCTSSTATCNYWPAVVAAYYQNIPLVILTSDRNPAMLKQREDQMIDQVGMFDRHVKKSVNLPIVDDQDDFIFCQRLVNEALLELDHHGMGPVHINIPMKAYNNSFNVKQLPNVVRFERLDKISEKVAWNKKIEQLKEAKSILVVCGQMSYVSDKLRANLDRFFEKFNASLTMEYMANIYSGGGINTSLCFDTRYITEKKFAEFVPDIVISYGGNIMSGVKEMLRKYAGKYEHWLIQEDGTVVDLFKSITTIFECKAEYFFERCVDGTDNGQQNDLTYHNAIKKYAESVIYPEFVYSNVWTIKNIVEKIPSDSILHLSINDAIRITNFFRLQDKVKVYANIGTHGIDGCMSSMLGQAVVSDKLCFLIIGDLAFFYDMNALGINEIGSNVRILLLNNRGGEEFYYNQVWKNEASDLHTTARHNTDAASWVLTAGLEYLPVTDKTSFEKALPIFMDEKSERPILMEVFTEMKQDSDVIYDFYDLSRPRDIKSETIRRSKELIKATIGQEKAQKIAGIFKK